VKSTDKEKRMSRKIKYYNADKYVLVKKEKIELVSKLISGNKIPLLSENGSVIYKEGARDTLSILELKNKANNG
jgi:hypothetical protein